MIRASSTQRVTEQGKKRKASSRRKRVRLAPGRRVEAAKLDSGSRVLVHPAGTVQLNESAAAILALCDGTRTREDIVTQILSRPGDDDLALDVRDFLDAAQRRGWIIEA